MNHSVALFKCYLPSIYFLSNKLFVFHLYLFSQSHHFLLNFSGEGPPEEDAACGERLGQHDREAVPDQLEV